MAYGLHLSDRTRSPKTTMERSNSRLRVTVDQHSERPFGVQPIQHTGHQPHIVEFATATDQNSHLPSPLGHSQFYFKCYGKCYGPKMPAYECD